MAKDPGFIFYPGDYLRDTQNLSEAAQVAYDRIMCEHMRNICITQDQLNFFTKRLNDQEKGELMLMLTKVSGGWQIEWVADSINKRKAYSDSRRANRSKKVVEKPTNISETYVKHMEIENENENGVDVGEKKGGSGEKNFALVFPHGSEKFLKLWIEWFDYRKAIKKPFHTDSQQKFELQNLGKYPEQTACEMIRVAIKNGWKNLRPIDDQTGGNGSVVDAYQRHRQQILNENDNSDHTTR